MATTYYTKDLQAQLKAAEANYKGYAENIDNYKKFGTVDTKKITPDQHQKDVRMAAKQKDLISRLNYLIKRAGSNETVTVPNSELVPNVVPKEIADNANKA